jgi:type II secretory pathway component PulC
MKHRLLPRALLAVLLLNGYAPLAFSDDRLPARRGNTALFSLARIQPFYEGGQMTGVQFSQIKSGGLFDQIGLKEGDIIVSFNGQSVQSSQSAAALLRTLTEAQQPITLGVRSASGGTRTLVTPPSARHVEPSPREADPSTTTEAPEPEEETARFIPVYRGDEVVGARFDKPHGVGRPMPGLRSGDVILEANGMRIDTMETLEALEDIFAKPGKVELLFRDASGTEALSSFEVKVSEHFP